MKTIIDGKRYDPKTATWVAEDSRGGPGDFAAYEEDLYRTRRGNWFVAGKGGPMTRYARALGCGGYSGGSKLIPLTPDEAREWLERIGDTDALEQWFGDTLEDA